MADVDAASLARSLTEHSPTGIAEQVRELIVDGTLEAGTRLPTVRDVATEVGVSVGTIAQAWALLREGGLVETRRRGGTRVIEGHGPTAENFPGWHAVDLLRHSPDPQLVPSLEDALTQAVHQPGIHAWSREHVVDQLAEQLAERLPDQPRSYAAVSSGTEALWLATRAAVDVAAGAASAEHAAEAGVGLRTAAGAEPVVAVEEPAAPGYLGVLRGMGLAPVGVAVDEQGPRPEALSAALEQGAVAVVLSPSGAFSDRHRLTAERAMALEPLLAAAGEVTIIEDDPLGPLAEDGEAVPSLEALFPHRTLRAIGFERAFGMDLRSSVLAGDAELIRRCIARRSGGVASTSRILQHALAHQLRDPVVAHRLASARKHYAARRELTVERFAAAGLTARSGPGSWAVWVEIDDEQSAALALGARGIVVDVGSSCVVAPRPTGLLRLSTAQLPEDPARLDELAATVAGAAAGSLEDATFV